MPNICLPVEKFARLLHKPAGFYSRRLHPDGRLLDIIQDPNPENPRTSQVWLGTMICFHGRYALGDKHDYVLSNYSGWDELRNELERDFGPKAHILPLFLYDHGGLTMSTEPFHCPWDSGQVGYIVARAKDMAAEGVADALLALLALRREVEAYDQYLRGNVYGFRIYGLDGEVADSCWGFYGDLDKSGMAEHIPGFEEFEELKD